MASGRPTPPPPPRPKHTEPWRHERLVQRVPAHLGETMGDALPPWLVLTGLALLVVIIGIVAFILFGGPQRLGWGGTSVTATRTSTPRAVTPIVTTIIATSVPSPTSGPTPVTIKYRVKAGDTLLDIAARYKTSVQAIRNANNLKDDIIRVGDELIIPLPTPTPPPTPSPVPGTPTPLSFQSPPTSANAAGAAGVIRHQVKRGDTLIGIAATYGSTVEAIRLANQLESDLLSVGQWLIVPVGAWSPTPSPTPLVNASATATLTFSHAAPHLLWPPDGHTFRGNQDIPLLTWEAPGTLKPNEFYVVHIDYVWQGEARAIIRQVKQGTGLKLASTDYPGANPQGTKFSWYVLIVSQPSANAPMSAASPPSATRVFVWH